MVKFPIVSLVLLSVIAVASAVTESDPEKRIEDNGASGNRSVRAILDTALPFVVKELGLIECTGFDHITYVHFFEAMFGKGVDFGGNYLCQPTCGGDCIPKKDDLLDAPLSFYYPFGCKCAPNRCDARGPLVTDMGPRVPFKVICVRDKRCTCGSMGPAGSHTGYLCNWINLDTGKVVTFLDKPLISGYAPTYSPVRWCSCCPA